MGFGQSTHAATTTIQSHTPPVSLVRRVDAPSTTPSTTPTPTSTPTLPLPLRYPSTNVVQQPEGDVVLDSTLAKLSDVMKTSAAAGHGRRVGSRQLKTNHHVQHQDGKLEHVALELGPCTWKKITGETASIRVEVADELMDLIDGRPVEEVVTRDAEIVLLGLKQCRQIALGGPLTTNRMKNYTDWQMRYVHHPRSYAYFTPGSTQLARLPTRFHMSCTHDLDTFEIDFDVKPASG